jgi:hypothetical protein
MLGLSCFLFGVLLLRLVLQLVCPWSSLTMLIVYIFPIFNELFPHFLNFVLFCSFAFVVLRCCILFFFAWCTVVALGVATCALASDHSKHRLLFFFLQFLRSFFLIFWIMFCFTSFVTSWCQLCYFLSISTLFLRWCCDFYIGDHHQ